MTINGLETLKRGAIALGVWATVGTAALFSSAARAADGPVEIKNSWNEGRYSVLQEASASYVEQREREILT